MKITATKLITEEADLPTPAWFKSGIKYFFITEETIIEVMDSMVSRWDNKPFLNGFKDRALDASTGEPITREEFEQKYNEVVRSFDMVVTGEIAEVEEKALVVTEAEKWAGIR